MAPNLFQKLSLSRDGLFKGRFEIWLCIGVEPPSCLDEGCRGNLSSLECRSQQESLYNRS